MPLTLPPVVFGSSALGNLYEVVPDDTKREIVAQWMQHQAHPVIDSAGKYGAGLSLENIGRFLKELGVDPGAVRISNKLGWKRVLLATDEPTFETGVWFGLGHDAVQSISHDGILECYEQGNELLGDYSAQLVSVHDPDEYLAAADFGEEAARRYEDVLDAYKALVGLREAGEVARVGVGSKDWTVIKRLFDDGVPLDWVMLANSFTILTHPPEVIGFLEQLDKAGVTIVNSAVFHAGFLTGGRYFDYQVVTPESHPRLFEWRGRFMALCGKHGISPALACCRFALSPPGVAALALNTSNPRRVAENVACVNDPVPAGFWQALKHEGLLAGDYPYL